MEFINLDRQYRLVKQKVLLGIEQVLNGGQYIMGPEVTALENLLSDRASVRNTICVSSGSDSLLIALMALGIGEGDEVITSPFSFIATAACIRRVGAIPVYVDISERSFNIDPKMIDVAITKKTKAIIAVSLFGQCADFHEINRVAHHHGITVIEDAAQSFGSTHRSEPSCSLTTLAATSFYPSKPLGGYGDGGACFTDDDELAEKMRMIRVHGQSKKYEYDVLGINARLDSVQAAIIIAKLEIFDDEVKRRRELAAQYNEAFLHANLDVGPVISDYNESVFSQYTIIAQNRDFIRAELELVGIPTMIFYPKPLHKQPPVANEESDCPVAERICNEVLSLPICPYMTDLEQEKVITAFLKAIKGGKTRINRVSGREL